jgi:hypothetical protein
MGSVQKEWVNVFNRGTDGSILKRLRLGKLVLCKNKSGIPRKYSHIPKGSTIEVYQNTET